jgi:hypothetical protein
MKSSFIILTIALLSITTNLFAAPFSFSYDPEKPNDLSGQMESFKVSGIINENLVILTHDFAAGFYFGLEVENSANLKKGQRLYTAIKSDTAYGGERLFEKNLICNYWKRTRKGAKVRQLFNCVLEDNQWTGEF